jgi:hypothetical protein
MRARERNAPLAELDLGLLVERVDLLGGMVEDEAMAARVATLVDEVGVRIERGR